MSSTNDWLAEPVLAPAVDGDPIRPLYDAAAHDELALPFCHGCDAAVELEQLVCDHCGCSRIDWRSVELTGVVHAATLMHRREPGLVRTDSPYPVIDVEVSSGRRIVMTTVNPSTRAPAIGTPVRIGFRRLGGVRLPAVETLEEPR